LVFLDEFDKICTPNITSTGTNFSYETQGQILSMIEGNTIPIDDGAAYINTRNTLFIAGGAYEGMEIESKKKFEKQKSIGFSTKSEVVDENSRDYKVAITDVIKYGLRVELAGRFSTVVTMYPLTDEELHGVVNKYISYYEKMLQKKIVFDKDEINSEIKRNSLGCRHIKQIIYDILTNALFEAPMYPDAKQVKITKDKEIYKTEFV
jgi:ATP-dependent Clp protease ATP-binding subunit ClpX